VTRGGELGFVIAATCLIGPRSRPDGVWPEVPGGTLSQCGCPPWSVALIWHAVLPGAAGEAVAQEGFAQLEVALPSSLPFSR
jgi:hypothetical protein